MELSVQLDLVSGIICRQPQTSGLVMQLFQTITEDIFIWWTKVQCESHILLHFRNPLTYILANLLT